MSSTDALVAVVLLVGFLGGIMVGIIVIVSVASRREDAHYSLGGAAPDAACRGARRLSQAWILGETVKPAGYRHLDEEDDEELARPERRR
jgi:hypothetical protein